MNPRYLTTIFTALFFLSFFACGSDSAPKEEQISSEQIGTTGNPAIDGISAKIAASPNDPSLYAARAALFYENGGYDEAIVDLQKALLMDSVNVEYHHLLADVYLDYARSSMAMRTMERAVKLYPERIPTLLKMSEFQYILKRYDESMKTIDQILRIDPQNAEAYFMFGRNFREMGDTVRAINSFQSAVENDPDLVEAWIYLGQLYEGIGDPLAERYYKNALEVSPNDITALHFNALYLQNKDDFNGAIELYNKIAAIDYQYAPAYFNAGLLYLEMDSIEQARKHFDLTVKTSPTHIKGYYYKGYSAELAGDKEEAKANYKQVLRMNSSDTEAQQGLERVQ